MTWSYSKTLEARTYSPGGTDVVGRQGVSGRAPRRRPWCWERGTRSQDGSRQAGRGAGLHRKALGSEDSQQLRRSEGLQNRDGTENGESRKVGGGRTPQNTRSGNTICEARYAGTEEVLKWDGHVEIGIEEKNHLKFSRLYYEIVILILEFMWKCKNLK